MNYTATFFISLCVLSFIFLPLLLTPVGNKEKEIDEPENY